MSNALIPGLPGQLDAISAAQAVQDGVIDPAALLAESRARTALWEPWLGAVVSEAPERPLVEGGPLAGVVTGIKDLMWVKGLPRLCGAPGIADPTPAKRDAAGVALLRAAGAQIAMNLSTHQFAYGVLTPQTKNPRAPERIAGGSSGGVAAALAAGLIHLGLGSDTGGSIRIPAACCGVVGIKPTYGSISMSGVQRLAKSMDTLGPMATSVADVAAALSVLLGRDVGSRPTTPIRVGMVVEAQATSMDEDVRDAWQTALLTLHDLGASFTPINLPTWPDAARAHAILLGKEALAEHSERLSGRRSLWLPMVRKRLKQAAKVTDDDIAWAVGVRKRFSAELGKVWARADLVIMPTMVCRVPDADAETVKVDGISEPVTAALTRLTSPWNLAGVPAGSVPAGTDRDGAPIGMQVIGAPHKEDVVIAGMSLIEQIFGGPLPPASPPQ